MILEIKGLTKQFGGLTAVSKFNMFVDKGEIVGLIGPNGAGKSTLFNLVTGVYPPTEGRVFFDGRDITGRKPHHEEIDFTLKAIKNMRDQGMTVLIVEHNMQILDLCDRVVVISFGEKICEGTPEQVREDKDVIHAYFGGEHAA